MPSPKLTAAGCPRFTGTVFKDYLDNDFKMFLRREGIARVLDATKDPRKLYIMPAMPASSAPETPVTVSSRASARRAQESEISMQDILITLEEDISEIKDADLASILTQLEFLMTQKDAAQATFTRITSKSLFDFLG